jgi:LacI family transcriptional regulator
VLNRNGSSSEKARQRVLDVVARMDYHPNPHARALHSGRTQLVGVILSEVQGPAFLPLVQAIEDALSERGMRLLVASSRRHRETEIGLVQDMFKRRLDGVILWPEQLDRADLASLAALGRCVVLGPKLGVDGVLLDQVQGAELATEYLIHRGHRRIAHLSGPARSSDAADRIAGYRKVLARFGICPEEGWVACGDYSEEGGYRAAAEVLRSRPTAIFAANDQMALGALAQLRRQGLRVPDDLSLVGYDDIAAASYTDPPLTTIRQPFRLAGRMAVAKLLRLLGEAVQGPEGTLQMQLIERASVQGCLLGAW